VNWLAVVIAALAGACSTQPALSQVPAFPGAEGAGAQSMGGRGGRVLRVTNLDDSGPGSFRAAIEAAGPRTIIFDIGGTIRLSKPVVVRHGRVTIAGQTAPGGGITLRDQPFRIAADDVIVRFIRSRLGNDSGIEGDSIWVSSGRRIILDHVSASWSTDETLSVSSTYRRSQDDLRDVTVQWSIIAESLCRRRGSAERHCFGTLAMASRGARISFHHNLWAHHAGRMPRLGSYLSPAQDGAGGFFDVRSNVFYNWGGRQAGYNAGPPARVSYNFSDNVYITGPSSRGRIIFDERNSLASGWFSGNSIDGIIPSDQFAHVAGGGRTGFRLSRPLVMPPVSRTPARAVLERALVSAGASRTRDSVDARIVASVRNRRGQIIDSQHQVGGWPQLARGTPWKDSDSDGMPDEWERRIGLNPHDARDGNMDRNVDGFTNVEEWLNSLV
jgi:pectate lyase